MADRGLTVRDVRDALADLPDTMPVEVLLDHALAGHGGTDCGEYDVELLAPIYSVERGPSGSVEVHVAWEAAG